MRVPLAKRGKASSVRVEYRSPDAAANPYLALSVVLAAGLAGIKNGYELPPEVVDNVNPCGTGAIGPARPVGQIQRPHARA